MTTNTALSLEARIEDIQKKVPQEHLNPEERALVQKWNRIGNDRFLATDDRLTTTTLVKREIPTTDKIPVHIKPYKHVQNRRQLLKKG